MDDCARVLRAARRQRRVSQRELAQLAAVPRSTVDRLEAGRIQPRVHTLVHLLRVLGYGLVVADRHGNLLELDDDHDKLRDKAGRRFPAHLDSGPTPGYFELHPRGWWGWERIAWPFGPGEPPEYTYWRRSKPQPTDWHDAT